MAADGRALRPRDLLDLVLPLITPWLGHLLLADDVVENQVQQPVLAAHVPVERGRAGVEFLGDPAHAQAVEPVPVEDAQRGLNDGFHRDRITPGVAWPAAEHAARGAAAPAVPRSLRP